MDKMIDLVLREATGWKAHTPECWSTGVLYHTLSLLQTMVGATKIRIGDEKQLGRQKEKKGG